MNRALWLLLWLQTLSWLRRVRRSVRTVRGAVLVAVGLVFVVLWLLPVLLTSQAGRPEHLENVRRFGALGLLAYTLLNLLLSSNERALSFTPAEVNLLFPAPFSRRQLLAYKVVVSFLTSLLTALILTLFMRGMTAWVVAAFLGLVLTFQFVQLVYMAVSLVISAAGAQAYNRQRRVMLGVVLLVVLAALAQAAYTAASLEPGELLRRVEQSPVVQTLLAPFRWFIEVYTAERLWPDLVRAATLALAVNGTLLLLVFALDAHFLESAAVASERLYARLQRLRAGGTAALGLPRGGTACVSLPSWPWWGGAGPLAWRQLVTAVRSPGSLLVVVLVFLTMLVPTLLGLRSSPARSVPIPVVAGVLFAMTFFLTQLVLFDFRGDLDRMDLLKSLPLPPAGLALGQLLVPVLLLSAFQWLVLACVAVFAGGSWPGLAAVALFAPPFNGLVFGLENLLFLYFPARPMPATAGDFQALGRQMLLMLAKLVGLGVAGGSAAVAATVTYVLTGASWAAAVTVGWVILTGYALTLVPLMALAFRAFDVARDTPP
jgi:hypothetical protein